MIKMPEGSPINEIFQMKQQGISNNQIIQNLQRQGYTNTQIFDAMNQADTKMAVEGVQPGFLQQSAEQSKQPAEQAQELFTQPPQEVPQTDFTSQYPSGAIQDSQVNTEEIVEAIIEEKWTELIKDVTKIVEWKNKVENRLSEIELKLDNLKENFSDLNKGVLGKINEYDKHILEIGSNIKAMEKVFSKVLPAFTENVNELSRIANKLKSKES
jgi:hypothetical protein